MSRRKQDLPPNCIPYGSITKIIEVWLSSREPRRAFDMDALGIHNQSSFYNSCFQAAKRSGLCRAYKQGSKIILVRNPNVASA